MRVLLCTDNSANHALAILGGAANRLHVHCLAMRNGVWDVAWTVTPIPLDCDNDADYRGVESISPSENLFSIRMSNQQNYDLNLHTREWEVSDALAADPMDWN